MVYQIDSTLPYGGLQLGYQQYLDMAPLGDGDGIALRRHDEY